jgi:choline dehydrogenase-like flavoprotein
VSVDAVVVGAGAGGGAAACVLAEAGCSVLLLERGDLIRARDDPRDHLAPLGGPIPGLDAPASHARPLVAGGRPWSLLGAVGGGTLVWGMQAWRFHPDDFRMASRYGVPAGSSLADWPIGYDELEPWYVRAEHQLGVAGDETPYAPRSAPYPLEPIERGPVGDWLASGAARCGWATFTPPLAVNSTAYGGRRACVRCSECLGFTCPTDAKNGSHNTFVPRAVATGLCTLVTGAQATRIKTDGRGRASGVDYLAGGQRRSAGARVVVLAGGAIETARLLLLSASRHHRAGIGNEHDHVGRHLQGHTYPVALGLLPPGVPNPNRGPGPSVATTAHNHGNPGVVGGGMLANDFVKTPVTFWRMCLPPDVPRWGLANKRAMRELYGRSIDVKAPVQEVPTPENRVTLHARLRDPAGLPLPELAGAVHPETLRTVEFVRGRLLAWLHASGAEPTWVPTEYSRGLSDWFHQAGTCRMSADPRDGVADPSGRVHGHDNLFIADGSVHVTNGGFNPALTITALALRTATDAATALT